MLNEFNGITFCDF